MSPADGMLDLDDGALSGVYFVARAECDALAEAARSAGRRVARVDLAGCHDKAGLLERLAVALDLPSGFGRNWDALADSLKDLGGPPERGHMLLLQHFGAFAAADPAAFDMLLDVLDEATDFAAAHGSMLFVILALSGPAQASAPAAPGH